MGTKGDGIFVWSTKTYELVKHLPRELNEWTTALAFVDNQHLYVSDDGLSLWDVRRSEAQRIYSLTECYAYSLLPSHSGRRLYMGTWFGGMCFIDLPASEHSGKAAASQPAERKSP